MTNLELKPVTLVGIMAIVFLVACAGQAPLTPTSTRGLGVTRAALIGLFTREGFNFIFDPYEDRTATGQPLINGQAPHGLAILTLIGPSENLSEVSLLFSLPEDDPEIGVRNSLYAIALLEYMFPEWDEAADWLVEAAKESRLSGDAVEKRVEGNLVSFQQSPQRGIFVLTIKSE